MADLENNTSVPTAAARSETPRLEENEDFRPLLSQIETTHGASTHQRENEDENSPLLSPQKSNEDEARFENSGARYDLEWQEEEVGESKSTWYLFMLTLSIGGLQIAWATELSNGSPYLLSLGLSKALLAFVWIAGPLTGVLAQPYIGILSDRSRIPWGKRRPFMAGGALSTIVSLLALAWTEDIVGLVVSLFGADPTSSGGKNAAIVFAVIWVYVLDFAINSVQAAIRAFIVDNAPTHQQEDANAWAGRITSFGNILGYLSGYVYLPRFFPFFGNSQFKVLCVFSAIALGSTVLVSSLYINERDPRLDGPPSKASKLGIVSFFRHTFLSLLRLPPQIRKICEVQFFNWIGWFPFLFYITTYIGQLHVNPIFEKNPDLTPEEVAHYWEEATRIGSFALLISAITSFTASVVLPIIIVPSYRPVLPLAPNQSSETVSKFNRLLASFRIPKLTLRRAWLSSHLLFAFCMACTFFVTTPVGGTILTAIVGISWALTIWAPFALISAEISKRETVKRARTTNGQRRHPEADILAQSGDSFSAQDDEHDQAGIVLGLHNVAVSAPQILATLISSVIFKMAQKGRGVAGDNSTAWVLRFGGVAAVVAAFMTWRLGEESDEDDRQSQTRSGES